MSNSSKISISAMAVVLTALLALAGCSAIPAANAPDAQNSRTAAATPVTKTIDIEGNEILANKMTVSATGSKKVMPDVAYVTVGATTQNKSMSKAQSQNRDIMNALSLALKAAGLTEEEIRTVDYSVYPMYDYSGGSGRITGYEVRNMIELTIKDIGKIGDYIDVAAQSGANTNYSISFDLLDSTGCYNEALADAMAKAKGKADAISLSGGYEITGTLEITESQSYYAPQYREYDDAKAALPEEAVTPVTAGLLEITANVTVVYRIN
jgi:uncharacterized protein YggE